MEVKEMSRSLSTSGLIARSLLRVEVIERDVINDELVGDSSKKEAEQTIYFVLIMKHDE
jgi:hypothetical protein